MFYQVEMSITTYCQAKCPSCVRTEAINYPESSSFGKFVEKFSTQHVDFDDFKVAIENMIGVVNGVLLCGELGDPAMHPDLEHIIEYCVNLGLTVAVNTNGGLRSEDFYRRLAAYKELKFNFGIDGIDAETSQKYRVDVDWNRAWSNMNAWFSECNRLGRDMSKAGEWSFLIFDFNKNQIDAAYDCAREKNIPIIFRLNRRNYAYVGDEEYERIRRKITKLK